MSLPPRISRSRSDIDHMMRRSERNGVPLTLQCSVWCEVPLPLSFRKKRSVFAIPTHQVAHQKLKDASAEIISFGLRLWRRSLQGRRDRLS